MWWLPLAALASGFGWGDADERLREHLQKRPDVRADTPIKMWFQLEFPLEGLSVLRVRIGEAEASPPPFVCAVRQVEGEEERFWCDREERFQQVVQAWSLGARAEQLSEFDWLRLFVLLEDRPCGATGDLLAVNPRVPGRALAALSEVNVELPQPGGVSMRLGCLVEREVQDVAVVVDTGNRVEISREVVGELRRPTSAVEISLGGDRR